LKLQVKAMTVSAATRSSFGSKRQQWFQQQSQQTAPATVFIIFSSKRQHFQQQAPPANPGHVYIAQSLFRLCNTGLAYTARGWFILYRVCLYRKGLAYTALCVFVQHWAPHRLCLYTTMQGLFFQGSFDSTRLVYTAQRFFTLHQA
jgi:hypothetical protein